ncbi:MAG TPA: nitrilase-related carbon-nitrogen hydrolase [Armatimonadota bacterium]
MKIRVGVGQLKAKKADYEANLGQVGDLFEQCAEEGRAFDVLVLPETVMSGYFLEGGVAEVARTRDDLYADLSRVYRARAGQEAPLLDVVAGFYELRAGKYYNSYLYATLGPDGLEGQGIRHVHRKVFLPTYGVFDEERFVARGFRFEAFATRYAPVSLLVCEDAWHSISGTIAALKGAQVLFIGSASPGRGFEDAETGSLKHWKGVASSIASEHGVFVVYSGLTGFEGGKGLAGGSMVWDPFGRLVAEGPLSEECLLDCVLDLDDIAIARANLPMLADLETCLPDLLEDLQTVVQRRHPN